MTGAEIYKRTPAYERQAREIRLLAPQWKLLLAFDGLRSLSEVALSAETPFAEALPQTRKFLDQGWIEEQPISLDQYLKRAGTPDIPSTGAAVPPATVLHKPQPEGAAAPPPLPASPAPAKTSESAPEKAPAVKAALRAMRLSAVVDFVTSLVGNISVGQLLVYRVFLRVPPELLLAEDISSVHLVGDTSLIQGEKLQKAIADAVQAVSKRSLPDSVFAPA
ncbi:MAG: hypothetical protein LV480_12425 [Methylacidiphilales bacterium]|nr:hypothetical protein [Candidatus Methylacidiphilales bacterium]